ncbi:MAG: ATP-dependent helicase HrpB [Victivallaceae bacterium]|nr:ATP-dependent helicase HrpB [Victivallaceae bacterium]
MMPLPELPITPFLPQLRAAAKNSSQLVVVAAPGAGKTTLLPLALLDDFEGLIYLVEPRRIAVRAAAARLAELAGECPGETIGYAVRGESRRGKTTKLLVVTPGVLLAALQEDPSLANVGAILFDEFHERGVQTDLALTLALASRENFATHLKIVVMSATIDAEKIAGFLHAQVVSVPGRLFPVEIRREAASGNLRELPKETARAVLRILPLTQRDALVFLPGAGEIARTAELLENALHGTAEVIPLHGMLDLAAQNRIFSPSSHRRVILATNIAESSITVPGIDAVIDAGWEKRLRFDPGAGLSFLETRRISRHSAGQRAGRAGRVAPGKVFRLYPAFDEAGFPAGNVPEILECDLAETALAIARFGVRPGELHWLDPPPETNFRVAEKLLESLGALDENRTITPFGNEMAALPVHPRLAAMILDAKKRGAGALGCALAALLEERDAERIGTSADLREKVEIFRRAPEKFGNTGKLYARLLRDCGVSGGISDLDLCGELVGRAFPEWIGRRRDASRTEFLLATSGGARLRDEADGFSAEFLAVARLDGHTAGKSVIRLAAALDPESLETLFPGRIVTRHVVELSADGRATGFVERRFGAIVLERERETVDPALLAGAVIRDALRRGIALPPATDKKANLLLRRICFAYEREGDLYPDWENEKWGDFLASDEAAAAFGNIRTSGDLEKLPWHTLIRNFLGESRFRSLEKLYPAEFRTPAGALHAIDYSDGHPKLSVRIQELFGLNTHPTVGNAKIPLRLELLSPAGRPVQITSDLPGFWRGSWERVRRDMRSRYPKHFWPEDPRIEQATLRTLKPKK